MNLGVALPGRFPAEFPEDESAYFTWLESVSELGANAVRLYTLLPPAFYAALDRHNRLHPDRRLWLIQGVWTELPDGDDYLDPAFLRGFQAEIARVLDAVHGNLDQPLRAGARPRPLPRGCLLEPPRAPPRAGVGALLGPGVRRGERRRGRPRSPRVHGSPPAPGASAPRRDYRGRLHPDRPLRHAVRSLARRGPRLRRRPRNQALSPAAPRLVRQLADARPPRRTRPNPRWPRSAPSCGGRGWRPTTRSTSTTTTRWAWTRRTCSATEAAGGGIYATYHAYPYYPDFMDLDPGYALARDSRGPCNYIGYLRDLARHHGSQPVLIAEVGVPSSRGIAHRPAPGDEPRRPHRARAGGDRRPPGGGHPRGGDGGRASCSPCSTSGSSGTGS